MPVEKAFGLPLVCAHLGFKPQILVVLYVGVLLFVKLWLLSYYDKNTCLLVANGGSTFEDLDSLDQFDSFVAAYSVLIVGFKLTFLLLLSTGGINLHGGDNVVK